MKSYDSEYDDVVWDAGKTVLLVDLWNILQAKRIIKDFERVQKALKDEEDSVELVADFHTAFFEYEPGIREECEDFERVSFMERMLESPAFAETHANSAGDLVVSELATIEMVEAYVAWKDNRRSYRKMPTWVKHASPESRQEREAAGAIEGALKKAGEAINDVVDICEGFGIHSPEPGMGYGTGSMTRKDIERARRIADKIRRNRRLKRIVELAGPLRMVAKSLQGRKGGGDTEITSIALSDNIETALPSELALLACQATKFEAVSRLAQGEILSHKKTNRKDSGKGGMVIVRDTSGSMDYNLKNESAAALAMAIGYIAKRQKRWVAFVSYSGGTPGHFHIMPPGHWDEDNLIDSLTHFYGGGSYCDLPLVELPNVYWPEFLRAGMPRKATDVIFITDAIANPEESVIANFNAWKKAEKVKAHTLLIDGDGHAVSRFSDTLFRMPAITTTNAGVHHVLSL